MTCPSVELPYAIVPRHNVLDRSIDGKMTLARRPAVAVLRILHGTTAVAFGFLALLYLLGGLLGADRAKEYSTFGDRTRERRHRGLGRRRVTFSSGVYVGPELLLADRGY
jgi:hypothetical protein